MSRLLVTQDRLRDVAQRIARLERALAREGSREVEMTLRSLYKLRTSLEQEFEELAHANWVDVLNYRLSESKVTVQLVGRALDTFQALYTTVYGAVKARQPKDTRHASRDTSVSASLDFAYSYSGSTGFVCTLPQERLLWGESDLDAAMERLFSLASSQSSAALRDAANQLGLGPVRALYDWAHALSRAGTGVDLQWRRNQDVKNSLRVQASELAYLCRLIEETSDEQVDERALVGTLTGFDLRSRSFRFESQDGETIRGSLSNEYHRAEAVKLPDAYLARIRSLTKVKYATDKPDVHHFLLDLSSAP